ncbi:MAG: hypothetical protein FDX21_09980 [Chlorobium sp.]|nr:MAG: hypothetical protein FDX21_09980 [Chlorobium sp.]
MAHDRAYFKAEKEIEKARCSGTRELDLSDMELTQLPQSIGQLKQLKWLLLYNNQLTILPETIGQLVQLQSLVLYGNQLKILPESIRKLTQLKWLRVYNNQLTSLPEGIGQLTQLHALHLEHNQLTELPESIGELRQLQELHLTENQCIDLPSSISQLDHLEILELNGNYLNPELSEAYKQGLDSVKAYLRAKAEAHIILNEAKLILVGEGEVGKTCLVDALLGNEWQEHDSTHGIEINPIQFLNPKTKTEITLNGWDFSGQRVYRSTHQLFFSAPAVYLVVWKPREGLQQGYVKEWIKLIKHREPEAKILVVATHGGPQQRQPDIDRQELWDLFGKETVLDFLFVDSKPDEQDKRRGIDELKLAIVRIASTLPEVGRTVPKSFADVRQALKDRAVPYLPLKEVLDICHEHKMNDEVANLFITISHRLGHFTHYQHDPTLRDIVILKPDWLATAISYVLDDEQTRKAHGLVKFSRLTELWNNPTRPEKTHYPATLHAIFLRLMGRFDLSYRVADPTLRGEVDPQSLIAQLVPDNRPDSFAGEWLSCPSAGELQQTQICRIVDEKGNSASAEGLFYQLIVRLHKYSLGRVNYHESIHWQRGLVLDDDYNGRALLEHKGNDVHITVHAPYPERFLAMLTEEVKYLVESFWEGLRCDIMVPCLNPEPCIGLFEVRKLIENKKRGRPEQPCSVCNEWQNIDSLLLNAPAAQPVITVDALANKVVLEKLDSVRNILIQHNEETMGRFDNLDATDKELLSKADASFNNLIHAFTDEAKEGPRLFSLMPVDLSNVNPRKWKSATFRLTLWCEHSQLPLPALNGKEGKEGVYEIELEREWFKKAAPYLKLMTSTLSLVLPVASSAIKLGLDDTTYKAIEEQLDFCKSAIDATIGEVTKIGEFIGTPDKTMLEHGIAISADGATLRKFHALLKAKDPGFGGLIRVMNKHQEFLWVHPQFEGEY